MSHLPEHFSHLKFYLTRPAPCPYLTGQVEQKIFTTLNGDGPQKERDDFYLNSAMNQYGFRRSQEIIYRPACPACMACVPVRINLDAYKDNQRLRRIRRHNNDLYAKEISVADAAPYFDLFNLYQTARHSNGDMAAMTKHDFLNMMQDGGKNAGLLTLARPDGHVYGVMLFDKLMGAVSAVYSFFDPQQAKRSLGTQLVLSLIDYATEQKLTHLYLGYWIKDCQKMDYKSGFPALERLGSTGWQSFIDD